MSIKLKRSNLNSQPESLLFGELCMASNKNDANLFLGTENNSITPINSLKIYSVNTQTFIIPHWNSFVVMNSGINKVPNLTIPKPNSFNIGQSIIIKNMTSLVLTINATDSIIDISTNLIISAGKTVTIISAGDGLAYSF